MKKITGKVAGLVSGIAALALMFPLFGWGCSFFLYQPKVPAKLRVKE